MNILHGSYPCRRKELLKHFQGKTMYNNLQCRTNVRQFSVSFHEPKYSNSLPDTLVTISSLYLIN